MASSSNQGFFEFSSSDIQKIKQGRNFYVSVFLRSFEPFINKYAKRFAVPNTYNFDELVQAGITAAYDAVKSFHSRKGNFKCYIEKSIKNAIFLEGRKNKKRAEKENLYSSLNFFTSRISSVHARFEQIESEDVLPVIKSKIAEWRVGLSPQKQKVLGLVFYKGMKQIQAASYLGLSRARIGQIMKEILKSGRICLADIAELN